REGRRVRDRAEIVEAHEIVEAVRTSWTPFARASGAELGVEPIPPGVHLRGDRLRLAQALGNVVGNALEHGRSPVVVRARTTSGTVRFEVDDAGPGLPAPVAALAARPRAGRGRRGRGLSIASAIAARHGGRLAAAPAPHGARLALELPRLGVELGEGRP